MEVKDILIWLAVFVVGSLIVTFLVNPNSFSNFKSNVKSIMPSSNNQVLSDVKSKDDPLIISCMTTFNECKKIVEAKNTNEKLTIIKIEKFNDRTNASQYWRTWQDNDLNPFSGDRDDIFITDSNFPVVLIAVNFKTDYGSQKFEDSMVAVCLNNSQLTERTKTLFSC